MEDEPMWAADRVVAPNPGSAITIPETANEFSIKGSSSSDTNKIMARIDAMTMKMDAQYKEMKSRSNPISDYDEDDQPMTREAEEKFMQTFRHNYRSNSDDKPYAVQRQLNNFVKSQQSTNAFVKGTFMDFKSQLKTIAKNHQASIQNLEAKFDRLTEKQSARPSGSLPSNTQPNPKDSAMKHSYSNDDTCFSIDEILEEDFDALLDVGSKILHLIEGTILEEKLFAEFDEFMVMTAE
ncbi:hypothetical protein Tco_0649825 [Tanacetum coccineum]